MGAFSTLVSLYNPMDCYEESVAKDMKKLLNDVSGTNKHRFLARYLINFPFFRRVKPQAFEKKYLPGITFEEKKKGDLVMLSSD